MRISLSSGAALMLAAGAAIADAGHTPAVTKDGAVLAGQLPPRVLGLVAEWVTLRRSELTAAWNAVGRHEAPPAVAPLE